jgi:UDP-N-acetylglucosamine 2-epimerase
VSGSRRPRVLTVVGNRPQFVKAAAVSGPLRELADEVLVHSGQHYDQGLSGVFFEELDLPRPDVQLGVGSGTHAQQTAATMIGLEPLLERERPAALLVYGDTNTTLGAALAGAKLGVPLAHVEAGMRSGDRTMPEEINRIAADHLGDLLLAPTATALANLEAEGLGSRAELRGDPMADLAARLGPLASPASLAAAAELLLAAAERHGPLVFAVHPGTRARLSAGGLLAGLEESPAVILTEPLGYLDFTCLLRQARALLTDSGGAQKEAYLAATRCLTLRPRTEWVETVESGWNSLAPLERGGALECLEELLVRELAPPDPAVYGDGQAGRRCAEAVAGLAASAGRV